MSSQGEKLRLKRRKTLFSWFNCDIYGEDGQQIGSITFAVCGGDYSATVTFKGKEYALSKPYHLQRWEMRQKTGPVSGEIIAISVPRLFSSVSVNDLIRGDSINQRAEYALMNSKPFDLRFWLNDKRLISKSGPTDVDIGRLELLPSDGGVLDIVCGHTVAEDMQALACFTGMKTWRNRQGVLIGLFVFAMVVVQVIVRLYFIFRKTK